MEFTYLPVEATQASKEENGWKQHHIVGGKKKCLRSEDYKQDDSTDRIKFNSSKTKVQRPREGTGLV